MYRAELLRCGFCSTPMDVVPVPIPGAEAAPTDVCPGCLGVFFEYFDGEPIGIAQGLLRLRPELAEPPSPAPGQDGAADGPSTDALDKPTHCPGCGGGDIAPLRYLDGPQVWRCHDCLSLSATRAQLVVLSAHRLPNEERLGLWARLRRRVRAFRARGRASVE